jgi:hypothetical protein
MNIGALDARVLEMAIEGRTGPRVGASLRSGNPYDNAACESFMEDAQI